MSTVMIYGIQPEGTLEGRQTHVHVFSNIMMAEIAANLASVQLAYEGWEMTFCEILDVSEELPLDSLY